MTFQIDLSTLQTIGLIIDYTIKIIAIGIVPEGRRPSSSTAWLLAILLLPFVGLPLFLLMGSPWINRRRHRVQQEAMAELNTTHEHDPNYPPSADIDPEVRSIIHLNRTLTSFPAVTGINHGLYSDYMESLDAMTQAIDRAEKYVYVEIYIMSWDATTDPFFRALERAVQRGVTVKLLFDQVGSWKYPRYLTLGKRLTEIGVDWHLMLPLKPWRWRFRRPDLRNHRKLLVVDGAVGFMGSQNIIDPSYLLSKNRRVGREWRDVMVELSGPVVAHLEQVFSVDWYLESGEVVEVAHHGTFPALDADRDSDTNVLQLVPSGPGYTTEPNLRLFNSMIHHAKHHLIMCSPYFIPDESMLEAVTSACYRGVQVDLLVSEQADQMTVDHAQSSYYQALLEAGVRIYRYHKPYVLHSKFMLADPYPPGNTEPLATMGSSNMDMRSFGLNYEITLMTAHGNLIRQLRELSEEYKQHSSILTLEEWNQRSFRRRYVDNVFRLTSGLQ